MTKSPVAILIFNRPDLTRELFNRVSEAKPEKLFIIADGPRPGNERDLVLCEETRAVVQNVDWQCEVHRDYATENMGMALREATGFSWVFDHVERAIFLEDDCIPEPTFFPFCDELLEKYKDDTRIMQINGHNFQFEHIRTENSYFFSRYQINWGWATWKRAWKYYDYNISLWPELKKTDFPYGILRNRVASDYFRKNFDRVYSPGPAGNRDTWENKWTWDYQWDFTFFVQSGISISPRESLMINAGFRSDGTNTRDTKSKYATIESREMKFPLIHPPHMLVDHEADDYFSLGVEDKVKKALRNKSFAFRMRNRIRNKLGKLKNRIISGRK